MSYHPPGPDRSPISRIFVILRTRQDLLSLGDLRLAATAYAGTEQVSPGNCAVGGGATVRYDAQDPPPRERRVTHPHSQSNPLDAPVGAAGSACSPLVLLIAVSIVVSTPTVAFVSPLPAPDALTENSAVGWTAGAVGGSASVTNDNSMTQVGSWSIRFDTDGGLDTWLLAPGAQDGSWDMTTIGGIRFRARAAPVVTGAVIRFETARAGRVQLALYDVAGRRVSRLTDEPREPGRHELAWTGADDRGIGLPPGVYWLRLTAPDRTDVLRIAKLR